MDFHCLRKKKSETQSFFLENGSLMLKELVASCDGKCNPIRSFSSHQILKATNDFHQNSFVSRDARYIWHKGIIQDRPVLFKQRLTWDLPWDPNTSEQLYCDIAVSSQMSSHKNVLKLLGCCLEVDSPILVFEYAENGPLNEQGGIIGTDEMLPWNIRLKIAKEIANAVTYLHMAFPRTIIHRDIKPDNIFLDENWTPKLSGFGLCASIPEGETSVYDKVRGTAGYVDPCYVRTGIVTESTDVYNFGVFLLVLFTGKHPYMLGPKDAVSSLYDYVCDIVKDGWFISVCDYVSDLLKNGCFKELIRNLGMLESMGEASQQQHMQMEACLELALRCTRKIGEDLTNMIEVAKELRRIERLV